MRHLVILKLTGAWSPPSKTIEKSSDFSASPIGIFAVREMTDARKHGEIEICECIAEPVGPRIRELRIMLRPAYTGWHRDKRPRRRFALHHRDTPRVGSAIVCETSNKISWLEEIVRERWHHVVEGVLVMGPMAKKV